METQKALCPRESGRLIAANSKDIKMCPGGITNVAKMGPTIGSSQARKIITEKEKTTHRMETQKALCPRESGRLIAANSKDIKMCPGGITNVAKMLFASLNKNEYSIKSWKQHELHPKDMIKETVDWIFVIDTLNFSFWTDPDVDPFLVHYKGKEHRGYWALCSAINRALDEGIPITSPHYYANMTMEQLQHIFRSYTTTPIPLMEQRLKHLHEAGQVLQQDFAGSFINVIAQCNNSAKRLLELITDNFSSYRDTASYQGTSVSFYKRAQILIADIWACFEGDGCGHFTDIDTLTMFADYRVPQVLCHLGALQYSAELMETLKEGKMLTPGQRLEVEIRGCSIWTVELIRKELEDLIAQSASPKMLINSIIVDFYLWDYATENWDDLQAIPIHRIRTQFY